MVHTVGTDLPQQLHGVVLGEGGLALLIHGVCTELLQCETKCKSLS